jgi:release factor glutamine methyltransferase
MHNLKQLFKIQEFLKSIKYPDYKRVSKNIIEFIKTDRQLDTVLKGLKGDKPLEYILHSAEFFTLDFKVNNSVLIPRIETEKLVSIGIQEYIDNDFDIVIDIGTGSGCIIISLINTLKLPKYDRDLSKTSFFAIDNKQRALNMAKENIKKYKLEKIIKTKRTNLLDGIELENKRVLILANLPYIPTKELKDLDKSVRDFEPKGALDGGNDGNKYYKELYTQIQSKKIKSFTLILETESSIIKNTKDIFKKYKTTIIKDCFDNDRFVVVKG